MGDGERIISHGIDVNTPSVARMYDWYLGGTDNYVADRRACRELLEVVPNTQALARNNRAFLRRVVRVLAAEYGVRQFLDHGSGLPTQDNVHQVAQAVDPSSRVVYIDNDPIVLAHGRTLLDANDETAVIQADMTDTKAIFGHEDVRRLIRLDEPVAALFVSVAHCIPDEDDPAAMFRRVVDILPSGSFMVVCQLVSDRADIRDHVTEFMREATGNTWGRVREAHDVHAYLEGLEIMPPGLVEVSEWRPDAQPRFEQSDEWQEFGGLARIP
ncbi:SAM-dependent methyltransferase [Streptomyces sp. SID3343]|uniref:SAM-dependent methyltransferase n=1 Tax=Streptomyces sp. SID3343 TaxID=2690260 RepID=UPI00136FE976|nr:SAM-dependent methyltransferase [Streptomyces sp. SID3343]